MLVAIAVVLLGVFLPVVLVPYAFSDDYPVLAMATGLGSSPWFGSTLIDSSSINGRPLAGLVHEATFWAAGSIDNLRYVRLFGVIGIIAVALLLHWALVRSGITRTPATLVAVLVCTLPAWQVYASWTVLSVAPYAALFAGVASVLIVVAIDGPRELVVDRLLGATAMLLAALLVYHPAAMFFWVFLAVALIGCAREPTRAVRIIGTHLGVAGAALVPALIVLKLGVHFVGRAAPNADRQSLAHNVGDKAHWFFHQPLYRALSLYDLSPSLPFAVFVAGVAVVGIPLLLRYERVRRPLVFVATAVVLIPLSFLPNLVVSEDTPSYRVGAALSSLVALYVCLGALGIGLTVRDWARPRLAQESLLIAGRAALAVAIGFVGISVYVCAKNVTTLFVEPQSTELKMIRSQVAALPEGVMRVGFVQTGVYQGISSFVPSDEFGLPSSAQPWTPEASVLLVLREEGRLPSGAPRPIVETLPPSTTSLPKNEPVIDLRSLEALR
jgi:hypothetical protein